MVPSGSALTFDDLMRDKEGLLPSAQNTRSVGEYGRSGTFLHYGLQKRILAGPYGPGITAVHRLHGRQSRILRIHKDAFWAM